ncbi:MAG: hypothetical protein K8F90_19095 [Hyphomicrobiales bacterium]|nr:hypothetical protein [Hyphomicrobiales bacterium]
MALFQAKGLAVKWCALVLLALVADGAVAEPSFDCTKANSLVEREICKHDAVAAQDRLLSKFYLFLKEQPDQEKTMPGQHDWIQRRDACGVDSQCLFKRYAERIDELAVAAGKYGQETGSYSYNLGSKDNFGEPTNFGTAYVIRMADGTLSGTIDTVSSPALHLCDFDFEKAEPLGNAWFWQTVSDIPEAGTTTVLFRFESDKLRIDSIHSRNLCGRRGNFDETYVRAK